LRVTVRPRMADPSQ